MGRHKREDHDVEALIKASASGGPLQRLGAVVALGGYANPEAEGALLSALADKRWLVRQAAAHSLARINPERSLAPILESALEIERDPSSLTAEDLVRLGIWELEATKAVELFSQKVREHDPLRGLYAELLGEIGDNRGVPVLIDALADENDAVRGTAATALGSIGSDDVIAPLVDALGDHERSVRRSVRSALLRLGSRARPALARLVSEDNRRSAEAAKILEDLDRGGGSGPVD